MVITKYSQLSLGVEVYDNVYVYKNKKKRNCHKNINKMKKFMFNKKKKSNFVKDSCMFERGFVQQ